MLYVEEMGTFGKYRPAVHAEEPQAKRADGTMRDFRFTPKRIAKAHEHLELWALVEIYSPEGRLKGILP